MERARALVSSVLALACASCAPAPRAAVRPPVREVCAAVPPCPSWVAAFQENHVPLHVYAYDGVSGTPACAPGKSVKVSAFLDETPVGEATLPCLDTSPERVPPAMVRIEGPPVVPGLHELRIDVTSARGVVQGKTLLSLPAFDIPAGTSTMRMGAEVSVGIGPDDLAIGPPQVYPPGPT